MNRSILIAIGCLLAGTIVLGFTRAQTSSRLREPDKEATGKAAVIAYAANIQAFPFYQCRYRYTEAQARSIAEALQGKFLNAFSCDNRLLVDGDKDFYEELGPVVVPDLKQAVPLRNGLSVLPARSTSGRYLSDGKREASYIPLLKSVNLFSTAKATRGIAHTPLGLVLIHHRNHFGPDVLMAKEDEYEMFSDGLEEVDKRLLVTVRFKNKKYGHLVRFSFDGARGYLPIRMATLDGTTPRTQVFVTDVLECNARWFPERTVAVGPSAQPGLYDVSEIKVLEFDAEHRPAAADFTFTVPAGTTVIDNHNVRRFFRFKQEEKIHINDLPKLFEMLGEVQKNPNMDTAIPPPPANRWLYWVGALGGIILTGGSAGVLWRRLRPRVG